MRVGAQKAHSAAGAEEVGHIQLAVARRPTQIGAQGARVLAGELSGEICGKLGVIAQREDLAAHDAVVHEGFAVSIKVDLRGEVAEAIGCAVATHGDQPGRFDELIEARRRGRRRPGRGVK